MNAAPASTAPLEWVLHLADNALVLGQRNAEWCSNGPTLEEDIAQANQSLDLIGQARMLYQHAASILGGDASEDRLAYFRAAHEFRNFSMLELPHFDAREGLLAATAQHERCFATTVVRNFLYSAYATEQWAALAKSADETLAAIAARAAKETRYHLRTSQDWLTRLGDGTTESHARVQAALHALWPYTQEWFSCSGAERQAADDGTGFDPSHLQAAWWQRVQDACDLATLGVPTTHGALSRGKWGQHTVHLDYLLAEMQSLARAHPQATW